jgi:hypothetical protein
MLCYSCGPPKALSVLSGVNESGLYAFPQYRGV